MTKVIMHGCNGKMGQMITGIIASDPEIEIVAGVDASDHIKNTYPVFHSIAECDIAADVVIDFCVSQAVDALLDYCVEHQTPCVLCTSRRHRRKWQSSSPQICPLASICCSSS